MPQSRLPPEADEPEPPETEHLDLLIVGAGLSGIDAAYRLHTGSPGIGFALFEARDAIGGTWDLFRYPGIRSDSDMTTLGFPFRPWRGERAIVEGGDILAYIRDTAREFGIDRRVRLRHRIVAAAWSSDEARWTVDYEHDGQRARLTCGFLFLCSGYYDYAQGHAPVWPGMERFSGRIVHPQFWPGDLDVAGRRVVVIGSGATAVTLVPALARQGAAAVTMLQRSPSYIVSVPSCDTWATMLRRWLPMRIADALIRWKNIGLSIAIYTLARRRPATMKRMIATGQRRALGGSFEQVSEADFDWLLRINFDGVVQMTRAFLPMLKARQQAQLVNVSSLFGLIAPPGQTAYAAAKFAVRGFSEALRNELLAAKSGVGVTLVHPGGVRTGIAANARIADVVPEAMREKHRARFARALKMPPERAGEIIVAGIERRRPRILVGNDAKIASAIERLMPVGYWRLLGRGLG